MQISASQEDYLNAIYILSSNGPVRITDIANLLKVQKSSTSKALNNLKNEKLINYEKYQNITLTPAGTARAKHIRKRHQLFERFLVKILKVDDELAKQEAEQLAHCVSCHTTAKLENFIENILQNEA